MKKRKVFEQQTIDLTTGEVIRDVKQFVTGNDETFFMGRTTEGLEWTKNIKTATDIQVLFVMLQFQNQKTNTIIFSPLQIEETAAFYGVTTKTIRNAINSLIANDFLVKIKSSNYIANPLCFYIGRSVDIPGKLMFYNSVKESQNDKKKSLDN